MRHAAQPSSAIKDHHAHEVVPNFFGWMIEDVERNAEDVLAGHFPGKTHQKAMEWALAPVRK